MGDQQVTHAQGLLQFPEQVQNLRLNGHIQGRGGFVANDQGGLDGQGTRDGNALSLSTRELMGKAFERILGQSHPIEQDPNV